MYLFMFFIHQSMTIQDFNVMSFIFGLEPLSGSKYSSWREMVGMALLLAEIDQPLII